MAWELKMLFSRIGVLLYFFFVAMASAIGGMISIIPFGMNRMNPVPTMAKAIATHM